MIDPIKSRDQEIDRLQKDINRLNRELQEHTAKVNQLKDEADLALKTISDGIADAHARYMQYLNSIAKLKENV